MDDDDDTSNDDDGYATDNDVSKHLYIDYKHILVLINSINS